MAMVPDEVVIERQQEWWYKAVCSNCFKHNCLECLEVGRIVDCMADMDERTREEMERAVAIEMEGD